MPVRFLNNRLNNLWDKLKYLNHKTDTFRIYSYIDFNVYAPAIKERFDLWIEKYKDYKKRENKEDIKLESMAMSFHMILDNDKHLKPYETKIIKHLESLCKDKQEFSNIESLLDKNSISFTKESNKNPFLILKHIFSLKTFSKGICVLSPDAIRCANVEIPKDRILKDKYFRESDCLLQIKKRDKILRKQEYRYYVSGLKKDSIHFRSFYVESEILNSLALKTNQKLYALNPFEIFCVLYAFLPNNPYYTIVFRDQIYHCLCHYSYGLLDFSVMVKHDKSLQDYYQYIEVIGEMFYCDWSGEAGLEEYINIECFFNMPLHLCLKILAFKYIFHKGLESSFYAREFYSVKSSLKSLFYVSIIIFICLALNLAYQNYKHHNINARRDGSYERDISIKAQEKENYKPMYNKIYDYVLDKKSLNFRFKD